MKRTFIHDLVSSFTMWFEHTLLEKGDAYTNISSNFYKVKDNSLSNYNVYSSPYKQWVYDSSITGASIPSGIYVNNSFVPRDSNGLKIDYNNGRVIFNSGVNSAISGDFAVKNFNIYRTTKSDEELIFETKFQINPIFPQNLTGLSANLLVAPCIFLKMIKYDNDTFSLGGLDESVAHLRATILSDNEYNLDGVGSLFADQYQKNFMLLTKTPLTEFGDVKNGVYNYNDYVTQEFDYSKLVYVASADYSRLLSASISNPNPNLQVGFLDFELRFARIT